MAALIKQQLNQLYKRQEIVSSKVLKMPNKLIFYQLQQQIGKIIIKQNQNEDQKISDLKRFINKSQQNKINIVIQLENSEQIFQNYKQQLFNFFNHHHYPKIHEIRLQLLDIQVKMPTNILNIRKTVCNFILNEGLQSKNYQYGVQMEISRRNKVGLFRTKIMPQFYNASQAEKNLLLEYIDLLEDAEQIFNHESMQLKKDDAKNTELDQLIKTTNKIRIKIIDLNQQIQILNKQQQEFTQELANLMRSKFLRLQNQKHKSELIEQQQNLKSSVQHIETCQRQLKEINQAILYFQCKLMSISNSNSFNTVIITNNSSLGIDSCNNGAQTTQQNNEVQFKKVQCNGTMSVKKTKQIKISYDQKIMTSPRSIKGIKAQIYSNNKKIWWK